MGQLEVEKDKLDGDEKEKQKVHPDKFPYLLMLAEICLVLSFFVNLPLVRFNLDHDYLHALPTSKSFASCGQCSTKCQKVIQYNHSVFSLILNFSSSLVAEAGHEASLYE